MSGKLKAFIPALIAALAAGAGMLLMGFFYYWIFDSIQVAGVIKGFIVLATLGGIAALAFVTYERYREIHEEDDDDLSKY